MSEFSSNLALALGQHGLDSVRISALCADLNRFAEFVLETNARMNLTGDRESEVFWKRHIEDAVASGLEVAEAMGHGPNGSAAMNSMSLLDVGSGAGLPGLGWAALWPNAKVVMIEARGKRADFIREAVDKLGLARVEAIKGRAETLAHSPALREAFDCVTARALAPMPVLAELTLGFVKQGGWLAAIKSEEIEEELERGAFAIKLMGGGAETRIRSYMRGDGKRCVVCMVPKAAPTPSDYPRREGIPERAPLIGTIAKKRLKKSN